MSEEDQSVDDLDHEIDKSRIVHKDKSIYSTVETVFDHKTRLILFKFLQNDYFTNITGAISTGKEANVYYCEGNPPVACKIFRIDSPSFQKMKRYVEGDYRFKKYKQSRVGFITAWTKKEFKNLKRMNEHGIPAPHPIKSERNVLLMEFLGDGEKVLPRLINVEIDNKAVLYKNIMNDVRKLYRECNLIHADLSPYNILYNQITAQHYIIDVSQAVLTDHPEADVFLIRDIYNMNSYFHSLGIDAIPDTKLYKWITGEDLDEAEYLRFLHSL